MVGVRAVMFGTNIGADVDSTGCDIGPPKMWVRDTATHFKNGLMTMLAEVFGMDQQFAVIHSAWTIGTVDGKTRRSFGRRKTFLVRPDSRRARGSGGSTGAVGA